MSILSRTLPVIATLAFFSGCGLTKSKAVAAQAVVLFHQQFNDSKFAEIYSAAAPTFKTSAKEADFMKFIGAVHRKLGAYKSATESGWRTNSTTGGTFVVLTYNSQFEHGSAVETFTFVISGESTTLQGYNINSPDLIIN